MKKKKEYNKTFRIEVGYGAYKDGKDDYAGKVGYVYLCDHCNDWRIQFFDIANEESLRNFNFSACKVFFSRPEPKKPKV